MEQKCNFQGCPNYPSYVCECKGSKSYYCKNHILQHTSIKTKHRSTEIACFIDKNSKQGVYNRINSIINHLHTYEISLNKVVNKILVSLEQEQEKILNHIQEDIRTYIGIFNCISKNNYIEEDDNDLIHQLNLSSPEKILNDPTNLITKIQEYFTVDLFLNEDPAENIVKYRQPEQNSQLEETKMNLETNQLVFVP